MKRLLILCAVALALAGCAALDSTGKSVFQGGASLTAPVQNVTPQMVSDIEEGAKVVTAGLVAYRRACIRKTIDQSCRDTITSIQTFTRPLCTEFVDKHCTAGVIADLRRFVAQNDQVNAIATLNLARQLIMNIQSARSAKGV